MTTARQPQDSTGHYRTLCGCRRCFMANKWVCVKRPPSSPAPPAAGGLVSGGWGPKVGSPAFLRPDCSRPPANIAACNFLTGNRLIPISTQVNFNRVGLYRLNSAWRNHRPHRPNRFIPTIHWLPVWPKGVIAGVSLISVVTQLNSTSTE